MPSFDVVSKVDSHEVDNARNQASKEIAQRYDFKGTDTTVEQTEEGIVIRSNSETLPFVTVESATMIPFASQSAHSTCASSSSHSP